MADRYVCKSDERREAVREARDGMGNPYLNGIDFLEVDPNDQTVLRLRFLFNLPGSATQPIPPSPAPALTKDNLAIVGGVRITGIAIKSAVPTVGREDELTITVDQAGDFSTYTLLLVKAPDNQTTIDGFDPQLSAVDFSFKVNCPSPFDCKTEEICPPGRTLEPDISYLAKDYASFRQVMLDRMALLAPGWTERHAADLGIALVETLAYVGDYISYRQDAIATEAYLGTARLRTSVKRHARLVDYRMHEGCNARTWIQVRVKNDITRAQINDPPRLPAGTPLLTTITGQATVIAPGSQIIAQAVANGAEVFETALDVPDLYLAHNTMPFYNWSASDCCLPKGGTRGTLEGHFPDLQAGDVLILREAVGPLTDDPADADPFKRCAVRLTSVICTDENNNDLVDPLTSIRITEIEWGVDDALPFALCVSSHTDAEHGDRAITGVSVALGNVTLADHGRTIGPPVESVDIDDLGVVPHKRVPRFRPQLHSGPLTFTNPRPFRNASDSAASAMVVSPSDAQPALHLHSTLAPDTFDWEYSPDLLVNDPNDRVFTVETEHDGTAYVRFGDDEHGKAPIPDSDFTAKYRVGNGASGNVGAESLTHIVTTLVDVERVWNPMAAQGGVDPETIEHVRQSAPWAFRMQERAVTMADYTEVAQRFPGVRRAAATLRWTGSWYTVFLTVERENGVALDPQFKADLTRFMERFRMAGQDLEIESAKLVPLEIEMHVCVLPEYFVADVRRSLLDVFNDRVLPDGRLGVFHPDNIDLGQAVYLSPLYAAAQALDGVQSVSITTFQRQDHPSNDGLTKGFLTPGRTEVFVLANDPNFPGNGVFTLDMDGGR